jgi:adenine/guanine phosphoribosyltransferase-like PRPP-binding protein
VIDDIVDTAVTFENITAIINEANAKIVKYICIKNLSKIVEINGIKIKSLL